MREAVKGHAELPPKVQAVFPRVIEVDDRPQKDGSKLNIVTNQDEEDEGGPDLLARYATEVISLLLIQNLFLASLEVYLSHR